MKISTTALVIGALFCANEAFASGSAPGGVSDAGSALANGALSKADSSSPASGSKDGAETRARQGNKRKNLDAFLGEGASDAAKKNDLKRIKPAPAAQPIAVR